MAMIEKLILVSSLATFICHSATTSGNSCPDGYDLNYTLPMFERCEAKMVNGSLVQLIPKLIPRRLGAQSCNYGRRHDGVPAGYRICRVPDCLSNPCHSGWCEEQMTNYTCNCPSGFVGLHRETESTTATPESKSLSTLRNASDRQTQSTPEATTQTVTDMATSPDRQTQSTSEATTLTVTDMANSPEPQSQSTLETTTQIVTDIATSADRQSQSTSEAITQTVTDKANSTENKCQSSPCQNGGNCTETTRGFTCTCGFDYYGPTCSCMTLHTHDVEKTRRYTFLDPALEIAENVTSFDFEVSANNDVHVGLSPINAEQESMYEIAIGGWGNSGGIIRRGLSHWNPPDATNIVNSMMTLSGIPRFDHYTISFAMGHIKLYRYGNEEPLIAFNDSNPLNVSYVGFWTGFGSDGYWKFQSFPQEHCLLWRSI
ncbi:uncharacterized protein LOC121406241 [Lytechinus variegatus]|uniref:uncharacterized protein LOC121406241 n=1 Tax=Lytechinus variegatus TaxID=7654 RepID=UPI001BB284A2|nr:uncharacterized protein LOC121406241 [Lytechinus variegatus]